MQLIKAEAITPHAIDECKALVALGDQHEDIAIRVIWEDFDDLASGNMHVFLAYEQDTLIGFLAMETYSSAQAEVSGVVHPDHRRQGVFRGLLAGAKDECVRRGIPRMLLICDVRSQSGKAFVEAIGAIYHTSEYRMDLTTLNTPMHYNPQLMVREARREDVDTLVSILVTGFGNYTEDDVREAIAQDIQTGARKFYVAFLDNMMIGTLNVTDMQDSLGIYGFVVLPDYRGQGYGRQILARTIELTRQTHQEPIFLEVETQNANALGLYESLGFEQTGCYDYYGKLVRSAD
ncbi:MAG: GNAT family N-acetyltransferase [Chloroflexi bacterium AL-W]|nr:GNAT family N-acetyltransferase [Chloroflexi bacterium AL-N1]NOK65695.1 GNAT family N-acetyltransferase [Chloroflexi bacterium AL-N10]NOK74364.1 GNAT family N-acetyltransferase [Chloroflexi bacterium AL-N5]NOK80728.1 GNAT family N-acetyltransferase [Chloroflexi bacterium AL-W]NOK88622.1 GNAT family N-acetyltransferase [Chloroflexi bacterium AL-N15]